MINMDPCLLLPGFSKVGSVSFSLLLRLLPTHAPIFTKGIGTGDMCPSANFSNIGQTSLVAAASLWFCTKSDYKRHISNPNHRKLNANNHLTDFYLLQAELAELPPSASFSSQVHVSLIFY